MTERCEFTTGVSFDYAGKPNIDRCTNAATWHKTKLILGGGMFACDEHWQRWCAKHGLEEGKA